MSVCLSIYLQYPSIRPSTRTHMLIYPVRSNTLVLSICGWAVSPWQNLIHCDELFFQTSSSQPTDAPNQPGNIGQYWSYLEQTAVQTILLYVLPAIPTDSEPYGSHTAAIAAGFHAADFPHLPQRWPPGSALHRGVAWDLRGWERREPPGKPNHTPSPIGICYWVY